MLVRQKSEGDFGKWHPKKKSDIKLQTTQNNLVLEFLTDLYMKYLCYSALNTARSHFSFFVPV